MYAPSIDTKRSLEERCRTYVGQLTPDAASYILSRGITKETAERFRIGYVADPLPGDEKYQDRLVIPYLTVSGVVQLRFRSLEEKPSGAKYLGDPGMKSRLFNTLALESLQPDIFLTEGEVDAISLAQAGLNAVGIPGANAWEEIFWRCFRYRKVTVVADGDDPSWKMAKAVADCLGKYFGPVKIVQMDAGEDANSFLVANGAAALRKRVGVKDE